MKYTILNYYNDDKVLRVGLGSKSYIKERSKNAALLIRTLEIDISDKTIEYLQTLSAEALYHELSDMLDNDVYTINIQ